jgi:hypothetical protein
MQIIEFGVWSLEFGVWSFRPAHGGGEMREIAKPTDTILAPLFGASGSGGGEKNKYGCFSRHPDGIPH